MRTAALVWLAVVVLAAAAGAGDAVYVMRGPVLPVPAEVNGYRQSVAGDALGWVRVRVEVRDDPVGSRSTRSELAPRGAGGAIPDGFGLPRTLMADLRPDRNAWDVATEILDWVRSRVRHDETDPHAQDAASVMARRRGRCSGIANLGAALLMTAGFEARTVSGLLVGEDGSVVAHRWLECRLPDAGWVPTDPTLGRWMITSRHVAFGRPVDPLPAVRVLEHDPDRPRSRLNRGAELSCRLVGFPPPDGGVALLRGPDGQRRETALEPSGRFTDLKPGRWVLEVRVAGVLLERRALTLDEELPLTLAIPVRETTEVDS